MFGSRGFFAAKQVFLILFKVTGGHAIRAAKAWLTSPGYLLGFRSLTKHLAWVVLILLLNAGALEPETAGAVGLLEVCTVPIVWLTALPIGDVNSYHQKHDVPSAELSLERGRGKRGEKVPRTDQDLALRLWCGAWSQVIAQSGAVSDRCALMVPSERAVAVAHIKAGWISVLNGQSCPQGSVRKFLASAAIAALHSTFDV